MRAVCRVRVAAAVTFASVGLGATGIAQARTPSPGPPPDPGSTPIASPAPGLYEGHLANGITVAVTVERTATGTVVTHAGAICVPPPTTPTFPPVTGAGKHGDYSYHVKLDGTYGHTEVVDTNFVSGRFTVAGAEVSISTNSATVSTCDPAHGDIHATGSAYPIPVARIGPARTTPADGLWTFNDQSGEPGSLRVWGGGAFVGQFSNTDVGPPGDLNCQGVLAVLDYGTTVAPDGSFALPWHSGITALSFYDPQTPTSGVLGATSGSWTYLLDSGFIEDRDISGCAPPAPVTDAVTLARADATQQPFPLQSRIPPGGTAASEKCKDTTERRIVAGQFVLCTDAKPKYEKGKLTLTGRTTINGFLYVSSGDLTVEKKEGHLQSSGTITFGVILRGHDLELGKTPLDLRSGQLHGITLPKLKGLVRLGGLRLDLAKLGGTPPTVDIDLAKATVSISAGLEYKALASTLSLEGKLDISPQGIVADLTSKGFRIPIRVGGRQLFDLRQLEFRYDQPQDAWQVTGGAEVGLPGFSLLGGPALDASASAAVTHGRLNQLSLSLEITNGGGVPGPFGTYVSGGSFDLSGLAGGLKNTRVALGLDGGWPVGEENRLVGITYMGNGSFDVPKLLLELSASADITVLKKEAKQATFTPAEDSDEDKGLKLASGNADLTFDFRKHESDLDTSLDVLDTIHGETSIHIDRTSFLSEGKLTVEFKPGSPAIKAIDKFWPLGLGDPPKQLGPILDGDAIVSSIGAGASADLHLTKKLDTSVTVIHHWGEKTHVDSGLGPPKSLDELKPAAGTAVARTARARRRTAAFQVAPEQAGFIISGAGSPAGQLVVRDPRGRVVADTRRVTTPVAELDHGDVVISRRPTLGLGCVIVADPRAGRWTVSSVGPQPYASVTRAGVTGPGGRVARVTSAGPRHVRAGALLRVGVRLPAGTTAQLRGTESRRGRDVGIALGTVRHGGAARVRVPGDYPGRRLTLVAVTLRDGVPVATTRSRRTVIVRPRGLARPRHVRIARGGRRTTVRFDRVAGAVRYIVTVVERHRRYATATRGSTATLPLPTRGVRVSAEVSAVDAATARVGPAARATAGGRPHRPTRHRAHRHPRRHGR